MITLSVSPSSIPDDGTTQATATVTVTDATVLPVQGDMVTVSVSSGPPGLVQPEHLHD